MAESARPRGTDGARVIQVIETKALKGTGIDESDMCREVKQYWDFEGHLLAESDPCAMENKLLEKIEQPSGGVSRTQTNANFIRSMDDEELAIFIKPFTNEFVTTEAIIEWLQEERKG